LSGREGEVRGWLSFSPHEAELHRVPITGGELLDLLVAGPERGQADLLAEVSEVSIGEHRRVSNQLVADICKEREREGGRDRQGVRLAHCCVEQGLDLALVCRVACYGAWGGSGEAKGCKGRGGPDVLSGEEDTESQSVEEVSGGEQAGDRAETKASLSLVRREMR
jgi:hypothetical protein